MEDAFSRFREVSDKHNKEIEPALHRWAKSEGFGGMTIGNLSSLSELVESMVERRGRTAFDIGCHLPFEAGE